MGGEECPPFDPRGCRHDQLSYAGRLAHFRELVNPSTLLTRDTDVDDALAKLQGQKPAAEVHVPAATKQALLAKYFQ